MLLGYLFCTGLDVVEVSLTIQALFAGKSELLLLLLIPLLLALTWRPLLIEWPWLAAAAGRADYFLLSKLRSSSYLLLLLLLQNVGIVIFAGGSAVFVNRLDSPRVFVTTQFPIRKQFRRFRRLHCFFYLKLVFITCTYAILHVIQAWLVAELRVPADL